MAVGLRSAGKLLVPVEPEPGSLELGNRTCIFNREGDRLLGEKNKGDDEFATFWHIQIKNGCFLEEVSWCWGSCLQAVKFWWRKWDLPLKLFRRSLREEFAMFNPGVILWNKVNPEQLVYWCPRALIIREIWKSNIILLMTTVPCSVTSGVFSAVQKCWKNGVYLRNDERISSPRVSPFQRGVQTLCLAHRRLQMKRFSLKLIVRQQCRVWGVFVGFLFACLTWET